MSFRKNGNKGLEGCFEHYILYIMIKSGSHLVSFPGSPAGLGLGMMLVLTTIYGIVLTSVIPKLQTSDCMV